MRVPESLWLALATQLEPPLDCRTPQLLRGRACYAQDNEQVRAEGKPAGGMHGAGVGEEGGGEQRQPNPNGVR